MSQTLTGVVLVWLLCTAPTITAGSLAGVLSGQLKVDPAVWMAASSVDELTETTLQGHTVFVYHALGNLSTVGLSSNKGDLACLTTSIQRKTSQLSVFSQREWNHVFWSPITENDRPERRPSNLIIFGIADFICHQQRSATQKALKVATSGPPNF
ncbi:hypothetical protein Hamer_G000207 [Homarus americanus]|uniref:Uncharacterized protein n=1 Tax=Homarus americanus TaxID=6706 RepID=A0A8J5NAI8_HOMAM|nr:hypothetical protein Hamer_G000207 [Homarus americanus]